jgi:curved DNA-binding protein CbpA
MMNEHDWQQKLDDRRRMETRARAILEVAPDASPRELKRAFRVAALRSHPDRNPDDPEADARFGDVVAAYRLLVWSELDSRLLQESGARSRPTDGDDGSGSLWGYFLWWRGTFFPTEG